MVGFFFFFPLPSNPISRIFCGRKLCVVCVSAPRPQPPNPGVSHTRGLWHAQVGQIWPGWPSSGVWVSLVDLSSAHLPPSGGMLLWLPLEFWQMGRTFSCSPVLGPFSHSCEISFVMCFKRSCLSRSSFSQGRLNPESSSVGLLMTCLCHFTRLLRGSDCVLVLDCSFGKCVA